MTKLESRGKRFALVALCLGIALFGARPLAIAQEAEDELAGDESADKAAEPAAEPGPAAPAEKAPEPEPAAPPAPPAPPPSPFTFTLKGLVSGSMFMQDVPFAGGAFGGTAIYGPQNMTADKWFLGGDVRQTRLTLSVKGPEVWGGVTPIGVIEVDLGNNGYAFKGPVVTSASSATVNLGMDGMPVKDMANPMISKAPVTSSSSTYAVAGTDARGEEALVPRLRLAYVEMNAGAGTDIVRVGQFHNLLLGMIAGSASHIGLPLGYGAGQLGYRSPGITYIHRVKISPTTNLDIALQINKNIWRDDLPACAAQNPAMPNPATQAPNANCLPGPIGLGQASMLPQIEGRVMLTSGMAENPLPFYAPTAFQAYVVAHYDQKDLSGVGAVSAAPNAMTAAPRDSMSTWAVQGGFKTQIGPFLAAANGWYGKNAGNILGHMFQMQALNAPDIAGFGAWGQLGLSVAKGLSVWAFAGTDRINDADARAANLTFVTNMQVSGQIAYTDGPVLLAAEFMYVSTGSLVPNAMMGMPATATTLNGMQPSLTLNYTF